MGNYLGGLEAVEAGVTAILDYSHCIHTPGHDDVLVNGLRDAGVRAAVYGCGLARRDRLGSIDERLKDAQRIAETYLSADDGLLTRVIALSDLRIRIGLGWAKSHAFTTGQCPVMKYNRELMQAILWDRMRIADAVNVQVIGLDDAPTGYRDFDTGAAKKFVLDPHGLVSSK